MVEYVVRYLSMELLSYPHPTCYRYRVDESIRAEIDVYRSIAMSDSASARAPSLSESESIELELCSPVYPRTLPRSRSHLVLPLVPPPRSSVVSRAIVSYILSTRASPSCWTYFIYKLYGRCQDFTRLRKLLPPLQGVWKTLAGSKIFIFGGFSSSNLLEVELSMPSMSDPPSVDVSSMRETHTLDARGCQLDF